MRGGSGRFIVEHVDAHIELQPVVGELHVAQTELAETIVGFRVGQVVSDVCEPGAARLQFLDKGESLVDRLVHGMGNIAEGVNDEIVEVGEKRGGRFGQRTEIGEIGGVTEAKAEDFEITVPEGHGNDLSAEQLERAVHDAEIDAGDGALRGRVVENV